MKISYLPNPFDMQSFDISDVVLDKKGAIGINPLDGSPMYMNDIHELHQYLLTLIEKVQYFNQVLHRGYEDRIRLCINHPGDPDDQSSFMYTIDKDARISNRMARIESVWFPPYMTRVLITEDFFEEYNTVYGVPPFMGLDE